MNPSKIVALTFLVYSNTLFAQLSMHYENDFISIEKSEPFDAKSYLSTLSVHGDKYMVKLYAGLTKQNKIKVFDRTTYELIAESDFPDINGYVIDIAQISEDFYVFYSEKSDESGALSVMAARVDLATGQLESAKSLLDMSEKLKIKNINPSALQFSIGKFWDETFRIVQTENHEMFAIHYRIGTSKDIAPGIAVHVFDSNFQERSFGVELFENNASARFDIYGYRLTDSGDFAFIQRVAINEKPPKLTYESEDRGYEIGILQSGMSEFTSMEIKPEGDAIIRNAVFNYHPNSKNLHVAGYSSSPTDEILQLFHVIIEDGEVIESATYKIDESLQTNNPNNRLTGVANTGANRKIKRPAILGANEILFNGDRVIIISEKRMIEAITQFDYGTGKYAELNYKYEDLIVHGIEESELLFTSKIDVDDAAIYDSEGYHAQMEESLLHLFVKFENRLFKKTEHYKEEMEIPKKPYTMFAAFTVDLTTGKFVPKYAFPEEPDFFTFQFEEIDNNSFMTLRNSGKKEETFFKFRLK